MEGTFIDNLAIWQHGNHRKINLPIWHLGNPATWHPGTSTIPSPQPFLTSMSPSAQQLLATSLDLPAPQEAMDEATFLRWLADVVDYWMQHRMEQLMSLCYTLDVSEEAVALAFRPDAPEAANVGLARLLYERQCRRIETKKTYQTPTLDDEDAW